MTTSKLATNAALPSAPIQDDDADKAACENETIRSRHQQ